MDCPKCHNELEIFTRDRKEIYVCPSCLSALVPDQSSIHILKHFCTQEILTQLLTRIIDDSLLDNAKHELRAEKNLSCPKCKSYMQHYDFDRKLRFSVNRCIDCGSIWLNPMQMPLVSAAFIGDSEDDINFKKAMTDLYEVMAKRKARPARSFDEMIAPFAVITGLVPSIPVGDNVLTRTRPVATYSLIIACAAVFAAQLIFKWVLEVFALYPDKVTAGEWYRLITYAFLHGGILHLAGNMVFLRVFGRTAEDELGWVKYLCLFALGAVLSGIFFSATSTQKDIPCVGASGAISAVIGAYLILFPRSRLKFTIYRPVSFILPVPIQKMASAEVPSMYYILLWIIMNVAFGMMQASGKAGGIAYWGHIGGFVAGIIFAEVYKNLRRG